MKNPGMATGKEKYLATGHTLMMKTEGGTAYVDKAELKDRAKMCLSRYYWAAFLVSLIFAILSGFGGSNANTQRITSYLEQNESGNGQTDQSSLIWRAGRRWKP